MFLYQPSPFKINADNEGTRLNVCSPQIGQYSNGSSLIDCVVSKVCSQLSFSHLYSYVGINLAHLFMKQQSILGSTMGSVDSFKKVMNKVSKNKYKPVVDSIFSFKDIKKAHERIENGLNLGKVVLSI